VLFGTIYAAHALYGLIGPGIAFVLLGAAGLATMLASALHGPGLAGIGLIGAMPTPLLVTSSAPNPWPVVLYLAGGGRERRKAAREARKAAGDGRRAETGQSTAGGAGSLAAADATRTLPASRLPEPVSASAKKPAKAGKTAQSAPVDDDLKDIEEILRKRGI